MRVDQFDFDLPQDLIALRPATPREAARLLHVAASGDFEDHTVGALPDLLAPGDLLIFNDTKVIPARLFGLRAARSAQATGGAAVELTLHKQDGPSAWQAFVKGAKKLAVGDQVTFGDDLKAEVTEKADQGLVTFTFDRAGDALFSAIEGVGEMPLPPYIASKRQVDDQDRDDYQTRFADEKGSVAAPTAGLHFTDELLAGLAARGINSTRVTLHVGAGTFLPVKADNTEDHLMHAEWGIVSEQAAQAINETKARGGKVVPVGTTSLRLLESAARNWGGDDPGVDAPLAQWSGETDIFMTPGFQFRIADRLMTNFHLPRSTLFMLVSAFSGLDRMQAAYAHAIHAHYRFYSYGDACLLDLADQTGA